jgi:hypothetical protein
MRAALAGAVLAAVAAWIVAAGAPAEQPLWPGARYTAQARDRAIHRGMVFIYEQVARNPMHFTVWGHDLLAAFDNIVETSLNPQLRHEAWNMGHERAMEWRRIHGQVPAKADVNEITALIFGNDSAERLGVRDSRFRKTLEAAARRFTVDDYLLFDPAKEPPPSDLPEECPKCGEQNERGAAVCRRDGTKLAMRDPYDIYQDALITTYTGDSTGILMGTHYRDVLHWLPALRPYPKAGAVTGHRYYAGVYTATHVVYTYNSYSRYKVSRECFPEEFAHLEANLRQAALDQDPETMGEYLDSLRAFGLDFGSGMIRTGFEYLLADQNRDGSWGDVEDPSVYGRYHPTWTAIDGLREYRWGRALPCPVY